MYDDRTQNYDPEIHEEYLIHDTSIPLPHMARLTIVPVVPWEGALRRQGPPTTAIFYHAVSLNVTTTKKVVNFFGEEKCTPEKILAPRMRKGPSPDAGMPPSRMVNPALLPRIIYIAMCRLWHSYKHNYLDWKTTIFCSDCESKIWMLNFFLLKNLKRKQKFRLLTFLRFL